MVPTQDLVILGLLEGGKKHGYELRRLVEERMRQVAHIAPGTLYYTLKKLERGGLVAHEVTREGNRPERQVYSITAAGRDMFQQLLREALWVDERPYFVFDAALYFYEHLDKAELSRALGHKLDNLERFYRELDALERVFPGRWPFALDSLKRKAHLLSGALDSWYRELKRGVEERQERGTSAAAGSRAVTGSGTGTGTGTGTGSDTLAGSDAGSASATGTAASKPTRKKAPRAPRAKGARSTSKASPAKASPRTRKKTSAAKQRAGGQR